MPEQPFSHRTAPTPPPTPDLATPWEQGADENEVDQATFYGDEHGYTDSPFPQA